MTVPALTLQYQGDGMFRATMPRDCDRHFDKGDVSTWEERPERSDRSHAHFFALVNDAWANLPERFAGQFPSPDHLRRWALIKAGYCDEDKIVLESPGDAVAVASYARRRDGYAVIAVTGNIVTTYTAQSQSKKAMGHKRFQESKDRVIQVLSELIGADITRSEAA